MLMALLVGTAGATTAPPRDAATAAGSARSGIHTAAHPETANRPTSTPTLTIAQSHCQGSATHASDLQAEFDRRGPVWGGGDGAEPIAIDGGRTLWLFGDTYIGSGTDGGPLTTSGLVHNSLVVQYGGSCFAYLLGKSGSTWTSAIDDLGGDWYWPLDGTYDPDTGVLAVVASHVHPIVPNDPWGWTIEGVDVLHFRVEPSIQLLDREQLFDYSDPAAPQFGSGLLVSGGQVFLYGCAPVGAPACYVAETDRDVDPSTLEYQSDDGSSADAGDAAPLAIDGLVGTQLHVTAVGDGFVASNQVDVLSTTVNAWWGPTATGPFSPIGTLLDAQQPPVGPLPANWFTYGGRVIPTSAGPIGVINVNTWDDEGGTVAGVYGPRFVALDQHLLDRDPFGHLESATAGPDQVTVTGWALDADEGDGGSVGLEVDVDGQAALATTTSTSRPDVAAAYPSEPTAEQGFDQSFAVTPGAHLVCVMAHNVGLGTGDQSLGCRSVTVGGNPQGHFESATVGPDAATVQGWALDPDTASPIDVHVYVDGHFSGAFAAAGSRVGVASAYPGFGPAHGFAVTVPLAAGSHSICVYAINTGSGNANPGLGCRSVSVGGNPTGNFESVGQSGGQITVAGWALDPDTAAPVVVHVYVDGRWTTMVTADGSRPDVGAAYPGWGDDHGFRFTFAASPAHHQVCVYAINVGAGNTNPLLRCRST
jgi:hypothetical protein